LRWNRSRAGTAQLLVWGSNGWLENILFCLNGLFLILFALRLYGAARGISAIFPLACLLLTLSWRKVAAYKTVSNCTLAFGATGLVLNIIGLGYVAGDLEWIGALEHAC
jgi:hypothetical protein